MQVSKDSIDLGIVVTDEKAALGFYRDQLGLEWEGDCPYREAGCTVSNAEPPSLNC